MSVLTPKFRQGLLGPPAKRSALNLAEGRAEAEPDELLDGPCLSSILAGSMGKPRAPTEWRALHRKRLDTEADTVPDKEIYGQEHLK